ncbi:RNA polymerase II-associated protein 3 [Ochlerotatus camptorhynchus]|uniref:RNA polymerase II-associated protein 3 n=1 Tax=Ochlerotatus camptorhynchus TaxID=644619 RepID=UPI0031E41D05
MSEALKAQLEVKSKSQQIQQSLNDLYGWEQEVKQQKEAQSRQQKKEEAISPPVRSHVDEMNKFTEDQYTNEKQQLSTGSIYLKDVEEAEHYNKKGIDLCRRAKAGADASSYNEKCDLNAIYMFTQAIELTSQNPDYYVNRALCYFNLERFENCITDCNAAIELDSTFVTAYYRRMLTYECMGNSQSAYLECQNILKMSKDASLLARTKHDMERIGKRLKEEADKHKTLGNKHLSEKDYQQACECFSKAISVFASEPIYYHNRSLAYYHLKKYECCLLDCNKAIELDANYFRPYYRRACIRELRTDYQGAINDLKKFLELVKDDKQRLTAEGDLERLQRILYKKSLPESYNWNDLRNNTSVVNFVQKPPHLCSKKPLKRIPICEVSSSTDSNMNPSNYVIASNYEKIPDSVIDKIFNNNTGERVVEPKVENKLENLFPSASMPKLKQLFSPPTTPSSPSEPIGKQSTTGDTQPVSNRNSKQVSRPGELNINKKSIKLNETNTMAEPQSTEKAKEDKDKINQGNCLSETVQEAGAKSEQESDSKSTKPEAEESKTSLKLTGLSGTTNPNPPIPSSSVKFYHSWCNMKTAEEKYQYLKTLENASLNKLLGVNMGSDMLSDILQVLQQFCLQDKISPMKILSEVAKNPEAGILFMMLGERDKYALIQLLDLMEELKDDKDQILAIRKGLIF